MPRGVFVRVAGAARLRRDVAAVGARHRQPGGRGGGAAIVVRASRRPARIPDAAHRHDDGDERDGRGGAIRAQEHDDHDGEEGPEEQRLHLRRHSNPARVVEGSDRVSSVGRSRNQPPDVIQYGVGGGGVDGARRRVRSAARSQGGGGGSGGNGGSGGSGGGGGSGMCSGNSCSTSCQAAIDNHSSIGCEYYAVDMDARARARRTTRATRCSSRTCRMQPAHIERRVERAGDRSRRSSRSCPSAPGSR